MKPRENKPNGKKLPAHKFSKLRIINGDIKNYYD